ncbi:MULTISPECIES: sensor histidine kinase [Edwardsiella]|uniref:histidine kinase n=2 Tax=Edwardsiella anguillarum TaxID=1821960 RepID=A0A076LR18_9GAMM|nr:MULTISPECIES: HAMP domain-containing sensor histidine kinase [Edwardsiella]AIJ08034.1 Osmosensitive K+ channel histidine kinase KdpD [Edwardsiella anguillarum ET080813]AKR79112.1 HAMP domain-containing histidine kinase [Edwardsiella sp. LADL05-105]KAB0591874.1 HAMP domain-containing histidine kinase [Edwardsiella anguillarum]UOU79202.1 HAMP domain-containing histidine kinase [Edwardsiella anguillarum]WHP83755.1 HAMP domain-containing histidine kinase [Edwardsiella anguillarum]
MSRLSLSQRLALVFALLLLVCSALTGWLQLRSNTQYSQQVIQRLSANLARHIAEHNPLLQADGLNPASVKNLFDQLMAVNPSVEVYLLDEQGRIIGDAAPPGRIVRHQVSLAPIAAFLAGKPLPLYGDDPRSPDARKVFSAAPLSLNGHTRGYLYVVLLGENYSRLSDDVRFGSAWRMAGWSIALILICGLLAWLLVYRWVTRPVHALMRQVGRLEHEGLETVQPATLAALQQIRGEDEVAQLQRAFGRMARRITEQWQRLTDQDRQRREFITTVSHDLRTPLTSLHGYLETLSLKRDTLSAADRRRYLDTALAQSQKVGRLAQQLFELARLEYGAVKPQREPFSFSELLQDVFQKFELAAEARGLTLSADVATGLPLISADIHMMERVLTNLLDNAVRHTPQEGRIVVRLWQEERRLWVELCDSGPGVPDGLRSALFQRPLSSSGARYGTGGLGLLIVKRMLELHGGDIALIARQRQGACFRLSLPL